MSAEPVPSPVEDAELERLMDAIISAGRGYFDSWLDKDAAVRDARSALRSYVSADTRRMDWIEERGHGTGEVISLGGACDWSVEVRYSRYGRSKTIGEGGSLRESLDDAMERPQDV